ncbi:MAG: thiamine-phosphate kinase [Phycisphaerae bacterium]|nr:thiamine-phosphate kinase [Phycisphaerae bacterium]
MLKSETSLIAWIRQQRTLDPAAVPIPPGDDMAGLNLAGQGLVLVTTDIRLDGVHFRTDSASPRQIGYKAVAVSLSDAAAMASQPRGVVVAVALPRDWSMEQARELTQGLLDAADAYDCPLVGGDVTSWGQPLAINATLISTESGIAAVRRNGAKSGDAIMVTGELGGSLASGRHLTFPPRVREARAIAAAANLHAMIDISDGLSTDLGNICDESGVGASVYADRLPLTATAKTSADPLAAALNDGEDFELCFTCSPEDAERLLRDPPVAVRLTWIGAVTAGCERFLAFPDGRREPLVPRGFEHFR